MGREEAWQGGAGVLGHEGQAADQHVRRQVDGTWHDILLIINIDSLQLETSESALQHSIEEVFANVAETELKEVDDKEEAIKNVLVNILKGDVVQGDVIEKGSARIGLKSNFSLTK